MHAALSVFRAAAGCALRLRGQCVVATIDRKLSDRRAQAERSLEQLIHWKLAACAEVPSTLSSPRRPPR